MQRYDVTKIDWPSLLALVKAAQVVTSLLERLTSVFLADDLPKRASLSMSLEFLHYVLQ